MPDVESSKAFENTAQRLQGYLRATMGIESRDLLDLFDEPDNQVMLSSRITSFVTERLSAMGSPKGGGVTVLLAYIGHGSLLDKDQDYCLLVRDTRESNPAGSSIRVKDLAQVLRSAAPQSARIIILDSCFAGAAVKGFMGGGTVAQVERRKIREMLEEKVDHKGVALLCAASAFNPARFSELSTVFGHALVDALERGDPDGPSKLSLEQVCDLTRELLREDSKAPRPEVHAPVQTAGDILRRPMFPNPAFGGVETAIPPKRKARFGRRRVIAAITVTVSVSVVLAVVVAVLGFWPTPPPHTANPVDPALAVSATVTGVGPAAARIALDPGLRAGFTSDSGGSTVTEFDTTTGALIRQIPVGHKPIGVALDVSRHIGYSADAGDTTVTAFDYKTGQTVGTVTIEGNPWGVAYDPVSDSVYATTNSNAVVAIDAAKLTVTATIPVDATPQNLAVDGSRHTVYVASNVQNTVTAIDTRTRTVMWTLPTGQRGTLGVAVGSDGDTLYAINETSGTLSVIDADDRTVKATVPVGRRPNAIVADSDADAVYVANYSDGTVAVIDARTNTVETVVRTGGTPWGIAVDSLDHRVFIPDGATSVAVMSATHRPPPADSMPTMSRSLIDALPDALGSRLSSCQDTTSAGITGLSCIVQSSDPLAEDVVGDGQQAIRVEVFSSLILTDASTAIDNCQKLGWTVEQRLAGVACYSPQAGYPVDFNDFTPNMTVLLGGFRNQAAAKVFLQRAGL